MIAFKNDEKCFLFHLKSSFRSQDIYIFVLTFFRITTHILLNISRIKGNQAMEYGQLIEHPKRNIFAENEAGKLVPKRLFF